MQSMKEHGFVPEQHGDYILGHSLGAKNFHHKKKYFITRGQHRTAIHAALFPEKKIKIILNERKLWQKLCSCRPPRSHISNIKKEYFLEYADSWQSVKSGVITKESACAFFKLFLESDGSWLKNTIQ